MKKLTIIFYLIFLPVIFSCTKPKEIKTDLLFVKSGIVERELKEYLLEVNHKLMNELLQYDTTFNTKFKIANKLLINLNDHYVNVVNYSWGVKASGELMNPLIKDSVQKYFFGNNPIKPFAYKSFDQTLKEFNILIPKSQTFVVSFSPQKNNAINNFLSEKTESPATSLFKDITTIEAVEIINNYELCFLISLNEQLNNELRKYRH